MYLKPSKFRNKDIPHDIHFIRDFRNPVKFLKLKLILRQHGNKRENKCKDACNTLTSSVSYTGLDEGKVPLFYMHGPRANLMFV